jgi:hypothetical protein
VSTVLVSDMDRPQLERVVMLYQGLARRLLSTIREHTKEDWKVRRECEDLAGHYTQLLGVRIERADALTVERIATERAAKRNDRVWGQFSSEAAEAERPPPRVPP